jgi:hypothetical protein
VRETREAIIDTSINTDRRIRGSSLFTRFVKSFEVLRSPHLSEEEPETDSRPPTSDALTVSIRDFLRDHDPIAIETGGSIFSAFGDLDESIQTDLATSHVEGFDHLMAVMIRKFFFFEFDSILAENILNLSSDSIFVWTETDFLPELTDLLSLGARDSEYYLVSGAFPVGSIPIQQEKMLTSFLLSKGMVCSGVMVLRRFDGVFCAGCNFLNTLCALNVFRSEIDFPDPGDLFEAFMIFEEVQ